MSYTPTVWQGKPNTTTPITADRLNKLEDGLASVATVADAASAEISALNTGELPDATIAAIEALIPEGAAVTPAVLRIDTVGQAPIDTKTTYVNCTYTVEGGPGAGVYPGRIKGRGNYTWTLPKKGFRVKLTNTAPIAGLPTSKDFALVANDYADDPSLINTMVAYSFGQKLTGLPWTPKYVPVETFINGIYWGVYLLVQNVQIEAGRVPSPKASGTTGLTTTGTWLMEIDARAVTEGNPHVTTPRGLMISYDDPDGSAEPLATYITNWLATAENALYTDGAPWQDYFDLPSWIDWYLTEELFSNQDSNFQSSCKVWKARDTATTPGKLYAGPLWDFGISLGRVVNIPHPAEGWFVRVASSTWIYRMFQIPEFQTALQARWAEYKVLAQQNLPGLIDQSALAMSSASVRDQQRWGYSSSWQQVSQTKRAWLATRIAWLDTQFANLQNEPQPGVGSVLPVTLPVTLA